MAHAIVHPGQQELDLRRPENGSFADLSQMAGIQPKHSFAKFLRAVALASGTNFGQAEFHREVLKGWGSEYKRADSQVRKTALSTESGTGGGYTVPRDYSVALLKALSEESFVYPRATHVGMESRETQCPQIDTNTVQASGVSALIGGINFTWGSSQSPIETEPTFTELDLVAWDLLGVVKMSNQMLMDIGPRGEDSLISLFGRAAAWSTEYAFFQGKGAGQSMPLGLLNSPGALTVSRTTPNQIANTDIAKMASELLPYSWKNAIWACSPTCLAQVVALSNYFINQTEHESANCGTLLTRPLFVTDKLQALGSTGDLVLFDPSLYVVGVRQEILVEASGEGPSFGTYQTYFRIWLRIDGKPWVSKSITLADGTTKVSPYVILK
jgi:HK97 family phage major capsid protein